MLTAVPKMSNSPSANVKVTPVRLSLETDEGIAESEEKKWGMPLRDVYKFGVTFYKDKEGKAMHLSYEDRIKLVAYTQQAAHGPLDPDAASPLGVLDVIGKDRRAAWLALGQMSQAQSMAGFVHMLDRLCPLFKPYLEAIQKDLEAKQLEEKRKLETQAAQINLQQRIQEEKLNQQNNKVTEEEQVRRIKDALNAQTYEQFLEYAQQQFPGNFDQQAILIRQLQEQHYQQYIQQLAVDRRLASSEISGDKQADSGDGGDLSNPTLQTTVDSKLQQAAEDPNATDYSALEAKDADSEVEDDIFPAVEEARMWVRGDIDAFKASADGTGGRVSVGHGETVTLRVPTHQHATTICWEFATDNYDIGFGVYFEWSKSATTEVTIHVSESDDDEADDDVDTADEVGTGVDPEFGAVGPRACSSLKAPVSIVVPIYRRDCHKEVYAGSHTYPSEGVYLLKFDNTYSLWRSKALYYKIYYTQ